jgi:predicted thioesterase
MKATANIPVGATATREIIVTREMTVGHFVEAMPEVFGTPIMIFHMEVTSGDAILPYLPEGWVSVGTVVNIRHLAATPVGDRVTLKAVVTEVGEHTVSFAVEAYDSKDKIGDGTHTRAVVEVKRFMKRVQAKIGGDSQQ